MKANKFPHGIMLHHFHGGEHPTVQGSISADEFAALITYLGKERFLGAHEWLDRALRGRLEPQHLCLTFDDALLCQYDIAKPVMDQFGLTGFWFIYSSVFNGGVELLEVYRYFRTTVFAEIDSFYAAFFTAVQNRYEALYVGGIKDFNPDSYLPASAYPIYNTEDRRFRYTRDVILGVDKYNSVMDDMIASYEFDAAAIQNKLWLKNSHLLELHTAGHIAGLHSWSHPTRMADLSTDSQESEYERNIQHLTSVLDTKPMTISHPCNSYSSDTLEVLQGLGIQHGFRANMDVPSPPSLLEYPREDHANIILKMRPQG